MWWPFKKTIQNRLVGSFLSALRIIQVSLCAEASSQHSPTMTGDSARVLAAQVANDLTGEDVEAVARNAAEPLKSQIDGIKHQIPEGAARVMAHSGSTREVVVATLRMRAALEFMLQGESYFRSDLHRRIEGLLSTYGPEFPQEIKPDLYLAMAHVYHQEHFGPRQRPS
jgi:hypothetical protein